MTKRYKYPFLFSVFLGLCLAAYMVFVGFSHNAQGEFFNPETGNVDSLYVLLIFLSWFLVAFIPAMGVGSLVTFFAKKQSNSNVPKKLER